MEEFSNYWAGHCTAGRSHLSDKVWAAAVAETPDRRAFIVWCWGPRNKTLQGKVMLFRSGARAAQEFLTRVRGKQNQEETYVDFDIRRSGLAAKLKSLRHQAQKELTRAGCKYELAINQDGQVSAPARTPVTKRTEPVLKQTVQAYKPKPNNPAPQPPAPRHKVDQLVRHPSFGQGRVLAVSRSGADEFVTVEFSNSGVKKLAVGLARLEIVELRK